MVAEQILESLRQEMAESIFVPNNLLPVEFHDKLRGGRTLAKLNELCEKRDNKISEHKRIKQAKVRNIEHLAKQVELLSEYNNRGDFIDLRASLDYNVCEIDDIQLHKNECALIRGMISGGVITAEELTEE